MVLLLWLLGKRKKNLPKTKKSANNFTLSLICILQYLALLFANIETFHFSLLLMFGIGFQTAERFESKILICTCTTTYLRPLSRQLTAYVALPNAARLYFCLQMYKHRCVYVYSDNENTKGCRIMYKRINVE